MEKAEGMESKPTGITPPPRYPNGSRPETLSLPQKIKLLELACSLTNIPMGDGWQNYYEKMVKLIVGPSEDKDKAVVIEKKRLHMLWIGAFTLRGHIDHASEERTPLWVGDNTTPVTELCDYNVISKTIDEIGAHFFNITPKNTNAS